MLAKWPVTGAGMPQNTPCLKLAPILAPIVVQLATTSYGSQKPKDSR